MEKFVKAHGIKLANASWIENLVVEKLDTDPYLIEDSRIWFNSPEQTFKMSVKKDGGGFEVKTFATEEDLIEFIELIHSDEGASQIGYAGHNSTNGAFDLPSGISVEQALDLITDKLSTVEASGGIDVYDESSQILIPTKRLNFVGDNIMAVQSGASEVTIYSPSPNFAPSYNVGTGLISDISTTLRKISNPTNNQFKIGNWSAGTSQYSLTNTILNYNSPVKIGFSDELTNLLVKVYDADGTSILSQNSISNISGDQTSTQDGITISIVGWEPDYFRFKAYINVSIDLSLIIPNGGRFQVEISHQNSYLGNFTKTQGPMFFDPDTTSNRPSIASVSITELGPVMKSISGINYYTTGSTFTIEHIDIDRINQLTWPNTDQIIRISSSSNYGISDSYVTTSEIIGWNNQWDVSNLNTSLTKTINVSNFTKVGSGNISTYWIDWVNGTAIQSSNKNLLIDTYGIQSTNTTEEFSDESRRLTSTLSNWDSSNLLSSTDLMIQSGVLKRQSGNWTTYYPTNTANYTSSTSTQYYYREFISSTNESNGLFYIGGVTETNITNDDVIIWISLDGTNWFNCNEDYVGGMLTNGAGCRINRGSQNLPYLEFTLGTNTTNAGTGSSGFGMFIKIEMKNTSSVQMQYIRITNW